MAGQYSAKDEQRLMTEMWSPEITDDPLAFVRFVFPWGKEGTPLHKFTGPRKWQVEELTRIARHIEANKARIAIGETPQVYQSATASGRGVGKSALTAWLNLWMMSCILGSSSITTANTETQLKSRTWAELGKWHTLLINSHWFDRTTLSLRPSPWFEEALKKQLRIDTGYYYSQAQLWSEENPDAFAGVHNQEGVLVIFDEACHDDKTEVLTDSGWKLFDKVSGRDRLITMNPETQIAEYAKPTKLFKAKRKGDMYLLNQRSGNFCVTPNHEMYYTTQKLRDKNVWQKKEIGKLGKTNHFFKTDITWGNPRIENYKIPEIKTARKIYPARKVDMDSWIIFLAWYLSEGSLQYKNDIPVTVSITQKDIGVLNEIKEMCESMGFRSVVYTSPSTPQLKIHSSGLAKYLSRYGRGCFNKRIPRYVMDCSSGQIEKFLMNYARGDGYQREKATVIYTSSEGMAGDLQEAFAKTGRRVSVTSRHNSAKPKWILDHWARSDKPNYVVRASNESSALKYMPTKVKKIKYDGYVYCAEVPPNHLLFTRRNGTCMWSGNSGIPKPIWTVSEGFFTEPILHRYWFCFSNPRRNTGEFYECFHKSRDYWYRRNLDSRSVEGTDVAKLNQIVEKHGADSDEARIEVKGEFPKQGDKQFIAREIVDGAVARDIEKDHHAGLIMGVDIARFGDDTTVIAFRRGRDARSIPMIKLKGKDNMEVANECAFWIDEHKPDAVCVDAGNGTGVIDRLREMGYKVNEIWFGSKAEGEEWADLRTEMWARMRDWLSGGCIPDDSDLKDDILGPEYVFDKLERIKLESKEKMKKRGIASPDAGDALAVTFAVKVARTDLTVARKSRGNRQVSGTDYDVFG